MALSLAERDRRYNHIRQEMYNHNLDVLIVIGRDGSNNRGNYRYLSGYGVVAAFHHFVVFPREEIEPIFFSGGSTAARTPIARGWVNDIRSQPHPDKLVVEEVRRFKRSGKIGLVEMSTIPIPLYLELVEKWGTGAISDATDIFKSARLIKSEEEVEYLRKSAKVADDIYLYLKAIARPGLTDWEVYGEVQRMIHQGHCEYSMNIIDCGEANALYAPVGNILTKDGRLFIEITPAYEGYYAQLLVNMPVSPYNVSQRKLLTVWEKSYEAAINALRPGSRACDVYSAAMNTARSMGCEIRGRIGHSLGLDADEFLSLDVDDETLIEPSMTIVIHPRVQVAGGYSVHSGGTFLVTKDGREALNRVDLV